MTRSRPLAAFTLLEVMAAVLVLGLLYTVLAEAAIRGLRSEGVSRRRVEASLIADRFLADLEAQIALGQVPTSGSEEQEVDVYQVGVSVQSFDPTPMLETIAAVEKERGTPSSKPRTTDPASGAKRPSARQAAAGSAAGAGGTAGPADGPGPGPPDDLLAPPRPGEESRLRRIDVSVAWQEGDREERVLRTTFAFDAAGLEGLLPQKPAATGTGDAAGADPKARGGAQNLGDLPPEEAATRIREIMNELGAEE